MLKPYLSLLLTLTLGAIATPGLAQIPVDPQPSSSEPATGVVVETKPRFTCEINQGQPTVMYHPPSQPNQAYAWATPIELGGGWTPERRCAEISRRLEFYRPDGLLELQTGRENGYHTVCATTSADNRCRIVLTVPPGEDPEWIRDRVFQNLTIANSGETTQAVTTFVEGQTQPTWLELMGQISNLDWSAVERISRRSPSPPTPFGIDLRPFLDPADGGTGQRLR